jgi:lactoylglutathione lyase
VRFGYTILYVRDVPASVEFYERAFGLERRFLHESGQYAELETGQTALAFAAHELATANLPGVFHPHRPDSSSPSFEVCFVTEDVLGGYERAVSEGAEPVSEPHTKPWGQEVAYVRDPDGALIEIASPAGS